MRNTITAFDVNESNIENKVKAELNKHINQKVRKKLIAEGWDKSDKTRYDEVYEEISQDPATLKYESNYRELVINETRNFHILRQEIHNLNEIDDNSLYIEENKIQNYDKLIPLKDLVNKSYKSVEDFKNIIKDKRQKITDFQIDTRKSGVRLGKKYSRQFTEKDPLHILFSMKETYSFAKDMDGLDLYDKFEMIDNLTMSNMLSDVCFHDEDNIFNVFNTQNKLNIPITKKLIDNRLLGSLLRTVNDSCDAAFVSNNKVTCFDNMYITDKTNNKIYVTRTLGELLFDIVDESLRSIYKDDRKQIYCTYDGTRPTTDEYHKWNGLQIIDIDLKEWCNKGGNINLLKKHIFEQLCDFHWFLWICFSSSGKGIHIWTKVAPPHHVFIDVKENENISKYWYLVNYYTKTSVVYDVLYRCRQKFGFKDDDFVKSSEESKYATGFELKYLDKSTGRITSGIRLSFDKNVMINPNFIDLHVYFGLSQTLDGFDYKSTVNKIIFRETTISKTYFEMFDEIINYKPESEEDKIPYDKLYVKGYDVTEDKILPLSSIKYTVRYNVCNTLAALYGKEGLEIAHVVLRSKECRNEKEINSFYSSALRNKKEPTKIGLEILKKVGVIKTIKPELKEETTNKFKDYIKKEIENAVENTLPNFDLSLEEDEYLGDYKDFIVKRLANNKINMIFSPPGTGKCLGKGTKVLMFDGSIKNVEDVVVGDQLMGMDSTPRNVLSIARGREEMFRITPNRLGESYVCNRSHINSFVMSGEWVYKSSKEFGPMLPSNKIIHEYNYDEYQNLSNWKKQRYKIFRVPLNFPHKDVKVSPYFLGYWLGDGGTKDLTITVGKQDIAVTYQFLDGYAKRLGLELTHWEDQRSGVRVYRFCNNTLSKYDRTKRNVLIENMQYYNLIGNKHIPKEYLCNDRRTRLFLFAGLIDSDGNRGIKNNLEYCTKLENLADDVAYLCRSLGYGVHKRTKIIKGVTYWRLYISGDFSDVPIRIERKRVGVVDKSMNPLVSGFKIEPLGEGDYYGFEIDGDKRFLLGDFTVTHNTEIIKQLTSDKRIMLVLPFISVITNKIETDKEIMSLFECYYGTKNINDIEYGINAVTTFDKFSRCNYEKVSKMFDYIFIDESHLLFTSSYRINATSNAIKRLKHLFFISQNDPFAAKLVLTTGTETGEVFFFGNIANIIRVYKKSLTKKTEFHICDDILDSTTRMSYKIAELINKGYRLMIPTNKGEIYSEKIIGMVEYLCQRPVKYGYYKRSNTEQEICRLINDQNTIGDYEIVFCSNYLSVGVDINDTEDIKFASVYFGNFSAYEIEQFNSRIRRKGIESYYFVQTEDSNGYTNDLLLEEPNLILRLTEEDIANFGDDKQIAGAKQEFIAEYDPVLHNITTPGFSYFQGKIQFNLEEYELINFETKYNSCYQHPTKISRELSKYGYHISVSTQFDGLSENLQKELKAIGIESAKQEKIKKHNLLVGTFIDLIKKNTHQNKNGLEFNYVIDWIMKNPDLIFEDREQDDFVKITFDIFATPMSVVVKSKEALNFMIKPARYLIGRYTQKRCLDIINNYVDDNGILKQKQFKRGINLIKLVESSDTNELSIHVTTIIESIYEFIDQFQIDYNKRISYNSYTSFIDNVVNKYIDDIGIRINTKYGWDKIKDSVVEMINDIGVKSTSKNGIRFDYNKLPDQDSQQVLNRRSIDTMVENLFKITSDIASNKYKNSPREKHIIKLEEQSY